MIGWLVLVGWLAGAILTIPYAYRTMLNAMLDDEIKVVTFDTWACAFCATFIAALWPLFIIVAAVRRVAVSANQDKADR